MSAASVIVRGRNAYLLSDGAYYAHDGEIVLLATKVVRDRRLRLALSVCGTVTNVTHDDIGKWLAGQETQAEAIQSLPTLANLMEQANAETQGGNPLMPSFLNMVVAAYNPVKKEAYGFICGSTSGPQVQSAVRRVHEALSPAVDRSLYPELGFYPVAHGRRIFEAQRLVPHPTGVFVVGGWGEITTVGPEGISTRTIIRWPEDRVGERIMP